jgi:3-deoxy-manno-octulosonate cytidylyltransferase (CMP-KDO synthetase)
MKIIGIIPARMGSTRFPGKPLATIHGIPMIGHVYFRSKKSQLLDEVYIATCDEEIQWYADSIGAKCIMTSNSHERCSDRTAEAMLKIEKSNSCKTDIVVMIQGDEPMITPEMIDAAVSPITGDRTIEVVNLMATIESVEEFEDPNEVKVTVGNDNNALYFSREPIPSRKKGHATVPMYKQVCVIPFQREFLLEFNRLEQTPLEIIESVDMLRVLENGGKVHMVPVSTISKSVDTPEDLREVVSMMKVEDIDYAPALSL